MRKVDLSDHLDDLTIPDRILDRSSSEEKVSTIKKKPSNSNKMNITESDFINQAFGGSGRISRSNSSSALAKSANNPETPKVMTVHDIVSWQNLIAYLSNILWI